MATTIREILEPGIAAGRFPGAQIYASVHGVPAVDLALGEARIGVPMTPATIMSWQCNTKPVTGIAICQQWERGNVDLDERVATYLPGFDQNGKADFTVRHLLTHTARFNGSQGMVAAAEGGPDEVEARICEAEADPDWPIGRRARYTPAAGYAALGAILRRIDGRPLDVYAREEIFGPLGMTDCWVGVADARLEEVAGRMGVLYDTQGDAPEFALMLGPIARGSRLNACVAGTGGVGPMHQLALLYEMLLDSLAERSGALLKRETVVAMTTAADLGDGKRGGWGLGVQVASGFYGRWFPRAFGHEGLQYSMAFADPDTGVVMAGMVNGIERPGSLQDLLGVSRAIHDALPSLA
ncbi:MAG TPA: serine hydrolase domain-containing protein [Acidimicrobiales bacterium]|nr:serine hydrolase domain-containing protein [Acidimicrobiales bacterium]